MIIQCAWCKTFLGEKAPLEDKALTHTICPPCSEAVRAEASAYLAVVTQAEQHAIEQATNAGYDNLTGGWVG
jgi:hypothetical protein